MAILVGEGRRKITFVWFRNWEDEEVEESRRRLGLAVKDTDLKMIPMKFLFPNGFYYFLSQNKMTFMSLCALKGIIGFMGYFHNFRKGRCHVNFVSTINHVSFISVMFNVISTSTSLKSLT